MLDRAGRPAGQRLSGWARRLDSDPGRPRVRDARGGGEPGSGHLGHLEAGLGGEDDDLADLVAGDAAAPAEEREDPLRVGLLLPPDGDAEPGRLDRRTLSHRLRTARRLGGNAGRLGELFGRRQRRPGPAQQRHRQRQRIAPRQQRTGRGQLVLGGLDRRGGHLGRQAGLVLLPDQVGGRHRRPLRRHARLAHHPLQLVALLRRRQQHRLALPPGPASPAAAVLQRRGVLRQVGVEHQLDAGQVEAARRHVGGHQHAGPPVTQRLQGPQPFRLGQLARDGHGLEAALAQRGGGVRDQVAPGAEDQRAGRFERPQHVDDGVLPLALRHHVSPVGDVLVGLPGWSGRDPHRLAGVGPGQLDDRLRQGGREEDGAPLSRRGLQDRLELLAEAHVEHLVGLIEHQGSERREVEHLALDVIDEPSGRADHQVDAGLERLGLAPRIEPADAGGDDAASRAEEPGELALHLHRQFASRGDHQPERRAAATEGGGLAEQRLGQHQAEGDGLSGAGARGDQQVLAPKRRIEHAGLNRRRLGVAVGGERALEGRMRGEGGEVGSAHGALVAEGDGWRYPASRGTVRGRPTRCRPPAASPRAARSGRCTRPWKRSAGRGRAPAVGSSR